MPIAAFPFTVVRNGQSLGYEGKLRMRSNCFVCFKQGFQQEITLHTNKIDQLIVFGEQLIQKSEPLDAILIEDELEELHRYCQEVFGRVARFHQRLTSRHPVRSNSCFDTLARFWCLKGSA